MPNVINLTCPSCGGKLQITSDIDRFACGYCGNELIVQRSGGAITIAPVVEGLKEIKTGVDKTASELAIVRLEREISKLSLQRDNISVPFTGTPFLILLTVVAILFWFFSGINSGFGDTTVKISFYTAILLASITFIVNSYFNEADKRFRQKVAPIDQMIAEKRQELEKHRKIVRNI